jgi:signal transduction histidine kinase
MRQMARNLSGPRLPAGRTVAVDAAVAAGTAVLQVGGTLLAASHQPEARPLHLAGVLLLAASTVPLLWRRRFPVVVFGVTCALTLGYAMLAYPNGPIFCALIVAFGTAVVLGRRWAAYGVLVAGFLAFGWLVPAVTPEPWPSPTAGLGVAAWLLLLLAISEIVRYRRALAAAERDRLAVAARMKAEELERRAVEDRLTIAHELHDVLGHSLSVINVQAAAGIELIRIDPERAAEALDAIRTASRDALLDVQAFLNSLRRPGENAPLRPAPSLAELDALVAQARAAGLSVHTRVEGRPRPVPAAVDLAACRVIQESLTNALRHAGRCTARVVVSHRPDALDVWIANTDRAEPGVATPGGGRGIPGMRQRIEALGGILDAGPRAAGGWTVSAHIPTPGGHR